MDFQAMNFWLHLIEFLVLGGIGLWVHLQGRHQVTEDKLHAFRDEVHTGLNGFGTRVARLEEGSRHTPTHNDIAGLGKEISELRGDVQNVVGGLEGIRRAVDLINQHLLNKP